VDGFKVLCFHDIRANTLIRVQATGDIPYQVFNKLGIIVGFFGDEFFIRAFEQAEEFAGGFLFHQFDEFFNPEKIPGADGHCDMGALVMRTTIRN